MTAVYPLGAVLSTLKVALGPAAAALFPAVSLAVLAAIDIPIVPSPVVLMVTVLSVVPLPVMATVPAAVPVVFKDTSPSVNVIESAPV